MKTFLRSQHVRPLRSLNISVTVTIFLFLMSGCSYFGEEAPELTLPEHNLTTRGLSTATGAAIGAGLGVIVGSESGNAGEGLVIGGLAGATAGALIGNELQNQEELAQTQKEELVRQDETLGNQRREIDELRDSASDVSPTNSSSHSGESSTYRGNPRAKPVTAHSAVTSPAVNSSRARLESAKSPTPTRMPAPASTSTARETTSIAALPKAATSDSALPPAHVPAGEDEGDDALPSDAVNLGGEELTGDDEAVAETTIAAVDSEQEDATGEDANCGKAQEEVERAKSSSSQADQLFYFRRALRLCPRNAHYHVEIGKVYGSMGREEDAQYEFRQALDLEPGNTKAREALNQLKESESGPVASRQTPADGDIEF